MATIQSSVEKASKAAASVAIAKETTADSAVGALFITEKKALKAKKNETKAVTAGFTFRGTDVFTFLSDSLGKRSVKQGSTGRNECRTLSLALAGH